MLDHYTISQNGPTSELHAILQQLREQRQSCATGRIEPGSEAPVLLLERGRIRPRVLRWGVPSPDGGVVTQVSRAQLRARPALWDSVSNRRCAVPVTGLTLRPALSLQPDMPLYMAGCANAGLDRFVLLSAPAAGGHATTPMPLLLRADGVAGWLEGALQPWGRARPLPYS